jgi:hypothetical protein
MMRYAMAQAVCHWLLTTARQYMEFVVDWFFSRIPWSFPPISFHRVSVTLRLNNGPVSRRNLVEA